MKVKYLITMLMVFLVPLALAQETQALVQNTINPDSGFFYKIDLWFEQNAIRSAATVAEKARLRLNAINERNEEMKEMAEKGLTSRVQEAKQNQEQHMLQIQNEVQQMTKEKAQEIETGLIRSRERLRYLSEQNPEATGLKTALQIHEENVVKVQEKVSQSCGGSCS